MWAGENYFDTPFWIFGVYFCIKVGEFMGIVNDIEKACRESFNIAVQNGEKYTYEDYKKIYVCDDIFEFTTYDDGLSLKFGEIFIDVCKAIKENETSEYFQIDDKHYWDFILTVNLLNEKNAIEWGTSIRCPWFDYSESNNAFTKDVVEWICSYFCIKVGG